MMFHLINLNDCQEIIDQFGAWFDCPEISLDTVIEIVQRYHYEKYDFDGMSEQDAKRYVRVIRMFLD